MSSDNINTQPTIDTVLDRINTMSTRFENRFDQIDNRFDQSDQRMARIEQDVADIKKSVTALEKHSRRVNIRLDKIESIALLAKAEVRELHDQLIERIPDLK